MTEPSNEELAEFRCARCQEPIPENFGSERNCAFRGDGTFTSDNWNCGTIEALLYRPHDYRYGDDETMQLLPVRVQFTCPGGYVDTSTNGWLILTRYKNRGRTSAAVHVGDFWPPEPLTLELAESIIEIACQALENE